MSRFALILALVLAAPLPAVAQSDREETQEGIDLLAEGARRLLEQLTDDLAPFMEQLEMQLEELQAYEAPEILPNGDILIRRKPDADPETAPAPEASEDTGPVDL